jgi:ethanolamine ammonia-lyase large subunit
VATIPNVIQLQTRSQDRNDYILHPDSGERLDDRSTQVLATLRQSMGGKDNVQIVISDGLNALSITDDGQLLPFLDALRMGLVDQGFRPAPGNLVVRSGRVRAGYRIGELLFGGQDEKCAVLHVIGERPGTGHHTFSVYITAPHGSVWEKRGTVDHDITKVVSGIATTALPPADGAAATVRLLNSLV